MSNCELVDGKPFYAQDWKPYDSMFIDYTVQYTQLMLGFTIKRDIFDQFPYNLPPYHLFPTLGIKIKALRDEMIKRGLDLSEVDEELDPDFAEYIDNVQLEDLTKEQQQVRALFDSFHAMSRYGLKMKEHKFPVFENIHIAQNMISICSLTEGYIASCLTYLLTTNIQVKKLVRKNTSSNSPIERLVFELTCKSFMQNIEKIEAALGVDFNLTKESKAVLSDLFIIRNLYVHNDGIVTKHAAKLLSKSRPVKIGAKYPLNEQSIENMLDKMTDFAHEIYKTTSLNFLSKTEKQLVRAPSALEYV